MNDFSVTSEPANPPAKSTPVKTRKRKMNAVQRKALSAAAKARWAAKKAAIPNDPPIAPVPVKDSLSQVRDAPAPPSPAVLSLQAQVVELVNQRSNSRQRLTQAHTAYLMAQGTFQAMQSELHGIEQEIQYRIQLIAQLENRTPSNVVSISPGYENAQQAGVLGGSLQGVSSEPSAPVQRQAGSQERYAVGSADDLRREMRGMM